MTSNRTRGVGRRAWCVLSVTAAAFVLAGCAGEAGGSQGATAAPQSPASEATTVVVIGDSIPYNSPEDCPGCTGFVDAYAEAITARDGVDAEVQNLSRHDSAQTRDIAKQVAEGSLDEPLESADTVIVSSGFNDQPPYWWEGEPCYQPNQQNDDDYIDAMLAVTPECVAEHVAIVRADLAAALAGVRERAPQAEIIAFTAYNSWSGYGPLEARGPETAAAVDAIFAGALLAWRDAVCEEAAAVGGRCLDLLEAFNGPSGTEPSGDLLAEDYVHPSQAGNDLILELLLAGGS